MEETYLDEAKRDGLSMTVVRSKDSPPQAAEQTSDVGELKKIRCLCGKWWAYRSGDTLILRCKLCRRDIVITGDNLTVTYR